MSLVSKCLAGLLALLWTLPAAATCPLSGSVPETTPASRFTVDDVNGIAVDNLTGLTWKRCPEGYVYSPPIVGPDTLPASCSPGNVTTFVTWNAALDQAVTLNQTGFAGQTDWRVPNEKELASLVERQCFAPAINETVFPGTPGDLFWSASPTQDSAGAAGALLVDFFDGRATFVDFATTGFEVPPSVRLVRGGP